MITSANSASVEFKKFFEKAPIFFIVLRADFSIVAASEAYLHAALVKREEITGRNFFEVFPPKPDGLSQRESALLKESFEKVIRTRAEDILEPRKYEGSETKYLGSTNIPILGANGEVEYIFRRVVDLTILIDQAGKQKTVEEERDLFFTHSLDLLAIVGLDGYFKRLNPSFERVLGYTNEELCAVPLFNFLHPDDVPVTKKRVQALGEGVPMNSSINRYRCKDGNYRWFSWSTKPIGDLLYTVGRDITDQINSEGRIRELIHELRLKNENLEEKIEERMKELRKSEAQVQQLQKMDAIGRLAGGIAHDFNNMLGAITLYCDLLANESNTMEEVIVNTQSIREVTTRAADLTRQLLVFSRQQVVQLQKVNLNELIQKLEKMLVRLIGVSVQIKTNFAEDLQAVRIEPSQMEQVILNLVVNARDALPRGGVITLETKNVYLDEAFTNKHLSVSPGQYVLLSVSDNGVGMDAGTIAKIFDPFFTTKPVGKGTGLGLSTIYGIIKQSKGTITVQSEPNKGTVFTAYLPIFGKESEEKLETPTGKTRSISGKQTILLVEDDETLRTGFSAILEKNSYHVFVAANGKEALKVCETYEEPIHLLLTDMVMPGISGLELSRKVVALRPQTRVLYMSGYTNDALANLGADSIQSLDFIQKPFGINVLLNKVKEVLLKEI